RPPDRRPRPHARGDPRRTHPRRLPRDRTGARPAPLGQPPGRRPPLRALDVTGVDPGLEGVPETLLWTLWHRALEARRPDAVLHDPLAVELVDRIDYPFAERFGAGSLAQWQALRVRAFDREVRRLL